jgi:hypothetical protein
VASSSERRRHRYPPGDIDVRHALLAAVEAGVPRSIPSDYRKIALGTSRNVHLRREFTADFDAALIQVTSVLTGAFGDTPGSTTGPCGRPLAQQA